MLHEDGEFPIPALNPSIPMLWDVTYIPPSLCGAASSPLNAAQSCYLAPGEVVLDAVDGERDHLDVALAELGRQLGRPAQLRGAHRGEIPRVGEQDAPPARGE